MKYCKKCKLAAKDSDTACAKCGGPISTFGSKTPSAGPARPAAGPAPTPSAAAPARPPTAAPTRPPAAAPAGPATHPTARAATPPTMYSLGGELQKQLVELEKKQEVNLRRGRGLSLLSLLVALAILFILYQVYSRTVLAYAVLENIKFEQNPVAENQLTVSFDVKTPGKVVFDRRSGHGRTEKVDLIAQEGHRRTVWSWPSDPKTGIELSVHYRGGWLPDSKARHFDVTRDGIGVEVVFLMDVTSSMDPYIKELKRNCIEFAEQVRREKIDCRLGLIGFGDVNENEPIVVFEPTSDARKFQSNVARLQLTGGGDPDESSLEAIEKALEIDYRPHTRICFVHITDASCHNREKTAGLVAALKERAIVTYVISQKRLSPVYRPLCVNGGSFYGIRDAPFAEILKEVARSIASAIKSD